MNLQTPQTPGPELPPPPPPAAPPEPQRRAGPPRPTGQGVEALLAAVRSLQRHQLWLEGALLGLSTLLVLALAGGLLASASAGLGLALLLLAPVAGAAVAAAFGLWLARRTVGDEALTARLIGQRQPELSLDVLSAVELARERQAQPAHSAALAEAFLRQMDERAARVDVRTVVDGSRARRAGQVLAGTVLLCAVVLALAGARWSTGWSRALAVASSPQAEVLREPITGDIELIYRYPAYTGLAPRTEQGTTGEISAPAGTEVVLRTRADREVERAELSVNGEPVPLTVQGGRELSGSLIVRKGGTYHFVFYGPRNRLLATGPDIALTVEADAPPQVTLLTPAAEVEVDPGEKITLKYEATDDYGLSELALVYRTPADREEVRVPLTREDGRRSRGSHTWDLGGLKVNPGDRITYYLEARDNDAVEGPKRGVSRTQVLRMYSAAEHRRAALEKAEALWGRMVDHLADRLEGPEREQARDVEKIKAAQPVDASGMTLVADMRALAQELSRERDAPTELVGALSNISTSLGERVRTTADVRRLFLRTRGSRGEDWGTGARLASVAQKEIEELEKDVLYLESLLDRQKLEALRELGKQLASERRELARLIEQYKSSPNEQVREEVMRQIQALRSRIDELMQRMSELRQGIRDEHLNAEALAEMMRDQDMRGGLDEVEKLMREGKADEALAKLQELAMQMDEMLSSLDEAGEEFGAQQYPELAEKFGNFMEQLEKTAQRQQQVAEQTKALRDQARSAGRERLAERGRSMKEDLLQKVEQAARTYQQVKPEDLGNRAARPLEEAQSELQNVRNALQVNDFDLAAEAAQRAEQAAQQLALLGDQQRALDEMYGNPEQVRQQSAKQAERLEREARSVQEVSRRLQSLFPPPDSQLGPQERQRLQQLAQQQEDLERQARGLRQQMEEMEQMAPVFGQEAAEQMEQVGQRMGEAAQRMGERDPGRGYGEQQAALEGLRQFQQQMRESQQGRGGRRGGLPLPMGMSRREGNGQQNSRDKVEIPDEEAWQAPKEFRKDLLDAMKQGTPEKYRDQVKRYYEELVK